MNTDELIHMGDPLGEATPRATDFGAKFRRGVTLISSGFDELPTT